VGKIQHIYGVENRIEGQISDIAIEMPIGAQNRSGFLLLTGSVFYHSRWMLRFWFTATSEIEK
jgi:hypothetical protein